jgi:hypothetical protein
MNATALLLAATLASPVSLSDADLLTAAERAFAEGSELRHDSAQARPAFAHSAAAYDDLWSRGHRNPDLALNRAKAHRLAGNLPAAVVALHEGLAVAPWDRSLQVALEDARSAVAYPAHGDLAVQCRPVPVATVGKRMSPAEAWLLAGALWLLACAAVARFAMTRAPGWLAVAGLCVAAVAALGVLWMQDRRERARENEYPLVVVSRDTVLRKGNSAGYPARLEPKLPRGVEARKLGERGGWVQVRLAGGAVGWLPASAVVNLGERDQ